jgi:hypothetical protein
MGGYGKKCISWIHWLEAKDAGVPWYGGPGTVSAEFEGGNQAMDQCIGPQCDTQQYDEGYATKKLDEV